MNGHKRYQWPLLLAGVIILFGIFFLTMQWFYVALPVIACGSALCSVGLRQRRKYSMDEQQPARLRNPGQVGSEEGEIF